MSFKKNVVLLICLILSIYFVKALAADADVVLPAPIISPLKSVLAPILIYHYVEYVTDEKDTIRKSLNTPPYLFIQQIETLKEAGYKSSAATKHGFEVNHQDKFSLYRIHPGNKTGRSLLNLLEQK